MPWVWVDDDGDATSSSNIAQSWSDSEGPAFNNGKDHISTYRLAWASVMSRSATSSSSSLPSSPPDVARKIEFSSDRTSRSSWPNHDFGENVRGSTQPEKPDSMYSDRAAKPPEPKMPDSPLSVVSTDAGATCCQRCRAPSCSPRTDSSAACPRASLEDPSTLGEADLIHVRGLISVLLPRDVECTCRRVVPPVTSATDDGKRPIPRQKARSGSPVEVRTPPTPRQTARFGRPTVGVRQTACFGRPSSSSPSLSSLPWQKAHRQQQDGGVADSKAEFMQAFAQLVDEEPVQHKD